MEPVTYDAIGAFTTILGDIDFSVLPAMVIAVIGAIATYKVGKIVIMKGWRMILGALSRG